MSARLNELTSGDVERVEQARLRASRRAARRELATEALVAAGFAVAAATFQATADGAPARLAVAAALVAVYAVLTRITFEVGEGRTHPLQLALVPMLVLLPPSEVPLAVGAAHVLAALVDLPRGDCRPQRLIVALADGSYSLAPAVLFAVLGPPGGLIHTAALVAGAMLAVVTSDALFSALRMRVGLGLDPLAELAGFAWVSFADACLVPIGLLAALAGQRHPALLGLVLPLAALLAIFAHERRGRLENAMQLQRLAQEGHDRLAAIVQNSSDLIAILETDGTLRTVTGLSAPIYGSERDAGRGEMLLDRVHREDAARVDALLEAVAGKPGGEALEGEWRMRYADGSYRHIEAVVTNLADDANVGGVVITARDVEARKAFEEQLRHRAFHDSLTGLANRALFYDRIEHALVTRDHARVAVLFVDLDDFKSLNDSAGHAAGDRLLEEVARRLNGCLRSGDTAARMGGDEFGVLLEAVTAPQSAMETAARVLEAFARPHDLGDGHLVELSASIGVAISAAGDRGVEELLRKADLAMYNAKRLGKRRAELYDAGLEREDPGTGRAAWFARADEHRDEVASLLNEPDGIRIVFQPIMDLRTGRVAGYESLTRIDRHPRRGPDVWFAQARRCGLGYELEAKAIAAALAAPGRPSRAYLAVNMSPSSTTREEVLRALPDDLDGIVVEVTENELLSEDPALDRALARLRERGARLAVDDTGAGYAGLTHVMRLRPDILKLDRALITNVDSDSAKAALIGSFVRYAREIDATVCAEGVETLAELQRLADLDVACAQGYVIARPGAPWASPSPDAMAACVASFEACLGDGVGEPDEGDHDRRLDALTRRVAAVTTVDDLDRCLPAIASELQADDVRVVRGRDAGDAPAHVLVDDPAADASVTRRLRAEGYGSGLVLAVTHRGVTVGGLHAHRRAQRPWSRYEIQRARLISHQLGQILHQLAVRDEPLEPAAA